MLTMMFQAFPDAHLEIEELIASGDHVVSRVVVTGTHKGAFAGIAPMNKKVSWHSCNVVEVKNGKAIRSRIYADHVSLFRQLGVIPMPKTTTAG
jgi:predicted ester cyclase